MAPPVFPQNTQNTNAPVPISSMTPLLLWFIGFTQPQAGSGFEAEYTPNTVRIKKGTAQRNKLEKALYKNNSFIAGTGMGYGYWGVNVYLFWKALDIFTTGYYILPALAFITGSRSQLRAIFLKNLLYVENKIKIDHDIQALQEEIRNDYDDAKSKKINAIIPKALEAFPKHAPEILDVLIQKIDKDIEQPMQDVLAESDRKFQEKYADYIQYVKTQQLFEVAKKGNRPIMLFGFLFALKASALVLTGGLLSILVGMMYAKTEYESKEVDRDLKLKKLQERQFALLEWQIKQFDSEKKLLLKDYTAPAALASVELAGFRYLDYLLTVTCLTSAYVVFSYATSFSLLEEDAVKEEALKEITVEFLILVSAGFVAALIVSIELYQTAKLYAFYQKQENDLQQEIQNLKSENQHINPARIDSSTPSQTVASETQPQFPMSFPTPDGKNWAADKQLYSKESKYTLARQEGQKKTRRILVFAVIFGIVEIATGGTITIPAIIGIVIFAMVMGGLDYWKRCKKIELEDRIQHLKNEKLSLLQEQKELLKSKALEKTLLEEPNPSKPTIAQQQTEEKTIEAINKDNHQIMVKPSVEHKPSTIQNSPNQQVFDIGFVTRYSKIASSLPKSIITANLSNTESQAGNQETLSPSPTLLLAYKNRRNSSVMPIPAVAQPSVETSIAPRRRSVSFSHAASSTAVN